MMVSYVVGLPTLYTPKFPNLCVWCNAENPNANIRETHEAAGWLTVLFSKHDTSHKVRAPACTRCAWVNRGYRLVGAVLGIATALTLLFFLTPIVRPYVDRTWLLYVQAAVMLPAVVPYAVAEVLLPRAFEITVRKEGIDYEFASSEYCIKFYVENLYAPWCAMGTCKDRLKDIEAESN